ncbi:MAG: hypothetical protein KGH89_08840 [Thaumarchaeota archaeon]|nr:hypothetical protein [Nitrososphaerota archaeon]MDE1867429.1 hypothetical protein [Nitrososphaerota archaeon]
MSEPEENQDKKPDDGDSGKRDPENMFKMIDDLLSHTNSSRRIFLIFIASALIFAPVALVMGGILLGHPRYSVLNLERNHEEMGNNMTSMSNMTSSGTQLYLVEKNGDSIIREIPFHPPLHPMHQDAPIFIGIQVFIFICIIFAAVLLFVALKEYSFFSKWNARYKRYRTTQDKIDDELGKD